MVTMMLHQSPLGVHEDSVTTPDQMKFLCTSILPFELAHFADETTTLDHMSLAETLYQFVCTIA